MIRRKAMARWLSPMGNASKGHSMMTRYRAKAFTERSKGRKSGASGTKTNYNVSFDLQLL